MEISNMNQDTVVLTLDRKGEYSKLFAILRTFRAELDEDNIDLEMLMLPKTQASEFLKTFFSSDERGLR